jgi:hypothetical protein
VSLANIRAEYLAQLLAVADIGVVHDYPRMATEWAKFLEFFKDPASGRILGWDISIESAPAGQRYLSGVSPNAIMDIKWVVLIRGYLGLQDVAETAKTMDNLVEAILAKFRPLFDLNGKALAVEEMQAGPITERDFGGVLAHYVELRQVVRERVTY